MKAVPPAGLRVLIACCGILFSAFLARAQVPETIGEALDASELSWTSAGAGTWVAEPSPLGAGQFGIGWASALPNEFSWVETQITGPGLLEFRWGNARHSLISLGVDGLRLGYGSSEELQLGFGVIELPPGRHTLRFETINFSGDTGCVLDAVEWTPDGRVSLPGALDDTRNGLPGLFLSWPFEVAIRETAWTADGQGTASDIGCISEDFQMAVFSSGPARVAFNTYASSNCENDDDDASYLYSVGINTPATPAWDGTGEYSRQPFHRWLGREYVLGNGPGAVRVSFGSDDTDFTLYLDHLRVTPVSFAEVLGETRSRFWSAGSKRWKVVPEGWGGYHDALQGAATIALASPDWLETSLTGPGIVSLATRWTGRDVPDVQLLVNGTSVALQTVSDVDAGQWQRLSAEIPSGSQTLRWIFNPSLNNEPPGTLAVDDFRFTSRPLPAFAAALDVPPGTSIESDVAGAWSVTTEDSKAGGSALVGAPGSEHVSSIALRISAPTMLRFWWKSSPSVFDASFTVTNAPAFRWHGTRLTEPLKPNSSWNQQEVLITGPGEARWTVRGPSPDGRLFLDELAVETSIALSEALDDPFGVWLASPTGAFALPSLLMALDRQDAVFLTTDGAWVERAVQGPAVVSFRSNWSYPSPPLTITQDGQALVEFHASPQFPRNVVVAPGLHTVRWTSNDPRSLCLDNVRFLSNGLPAAGAAVEDSDDGWILSDTAVPLDLGLPELEGGDGIFMDSRLYAASVSKRISGPAAIEWSEAYPVNPNLSSSSNKALEFHVNGERPSLSSVGGRPTRRSTMIANLPQGDHLVTWTLPAASGTVWLDRVSFNARPLKTLTEALGLPPDEHVTTGGDQWAAGGILTGLNDAHTDAVIAVNSEGPAGWLEWEVSGPSLVSFESPLLRRFGWPQDSGDGRAFVMPGLLDNGHVLEAPRLFDGHAGIDAPLKISYHIPEGRHVLRWVASPLMFANAESGQRFKPALSRLTTTTANDLGAAVSEAVELPVTAWWACASGAVVKPNGPPAVGGSVAGPFFSLDATVGTTSCMAALFRGPALMSFTGGHAQSQGYPDLSHTVSIEGMAFSAPDVGLLDPATTGDWQWRRRQLRLPAGQSMVRWSSAPDAGLDNISVSPLQNVPLSAALPWAANIVSGGAAPWMAFLLPDGRTVMAPSAELAGGDLSRLECSVAGPGMIEGAGPLFWAADASLSLSVDGRVVQELLGNPNGVSGPSWQWPISEGWHRLSFIAHRPADAQGRRPSVEIAAPSVRMTSLPTHLPGWSGISMTSDPGRPWYFAATTPSPSAATLLTAQSAANVSSWVELEMTGPRWIAFDWNKTTMPEVLVDGQLLLSRAAENLPQSANIVPGGLFVPRGRHCIRWTGAGPLTLTITEETTGTDLPGDPATAGLPDTFAFHQNAGWEVDSSTFVEGDSSWRAPRNRSLWLPVRGPAQITFATKATGAGASTEGIRLRIDSVPAGSTRKTAEWTEHTLEIPAGWHAVQWQNIGFANALTWLDDFRITPLDAFGRWCQSSGLPLMEWNAADDTDSDGLPNAVEFALVTDPLAFTAQPARIELSGDGVPVVRFPMLAAAPEDAILSIEVSANLQEWTDAIAAAGVTITESGNSMLVRLTAPFRFVRLKVAPGQ